VNLFFDLDTSQLVTGAGTRSPLSTLALKRGDNIAIKLVFLSNGQVVELAAGATGVIGIKAAGDYDGDYLAVASSWTKTGTGTSTVYALALDLNTQALADELGIGAAPDKARIAVMFELEFVADGIRTSSQTVNATVNNDVNRGTEGTPSALPDANAFIESRVALLQLDDEPEDQGVEISGTLNDGTDAVVFPVLPFVGISGTTISYSKESPEDHIYTVVGEPGNWLISSDLPGSAGEWTSSASVGLPNLVPAGSWDSVTNPHAWKPTSPATGTPVVTLVGNPSSHRGRIAQVAPADPLDPFRYFLAETEAPGTRWREIFI
jgi:hypothetical protein